MVASDVTDRSSHGRRERELSSGTCDGGDLLQVSEGGHVQATCRRASARPVKRWSLGSLKGWAFTPHILFPFSTVLRFQAHWSRICYLDFSGAFVIFPEHNLQLPEVHSKILLWMVALFCETISENAWRSVSHCIKGWNMNLFICFCFQHVHSFNPSPFSPRKTWSSSSPPDRWAIYCYSGKPVKLYQFIPADNGVHCIYFY